jgi:hypothetical protein
MRVGGIVQRPPAQGIVVNVFYHTNGYFGFQREDLYRPSRFSSSRSFFASSTALRMVRLSGSADRVASQTGMHHTLLALSYFHKLEPSRLEENWDAS